jgi:hypothetical protein
MFKSQTKNVQLVNHLIFRLQRYNFFRKYANKFEEKLVFGTFWDILDEHKKLVQLVQFAVIN